MFASTYALANVFPYLGFMVADLTGSSQNEIGYQAGYIAGSFMGARIISSFVWGILADKIGRKPVLVIGCASLCLFQLLFGASSSISWAIVWRMFMGFFSAGIIGTAKTAASELVKEEDLSWAMNVITGFANIGLVLGPALSGLTYNMRVRWLEDFFYIYPYFIPNVIASAFAFVAMILILVGLPESLPERDIADQLCIPESIYSKCGRLWSCQDVRCATFLYCFHSFISIYAIEVYPLWMMSSVTVGGFGMSVTSIGITMCIAAVVLVIYQLVFYSFIVKGMSAINLAIISSVLTAVYFEQLPWVSELVNHNKDVLLYLVIQRSILNMINVTLFTNINVMVNNSCLNADRGTVNGMTISLGSIAKSMGPIFGSNIFAWSINSDNSMPFNYQISFHILALCGGLLALYLGKRTPLSLNNPMQLKYEMVPI